MDARKGSLARHNGKREGKKKRKREKKENRGKKRKIIVKRKKKKKSSSQWEASLLGHLCNYPPDVIYIFFSF